MMVSGLNVKVAFCPTSTWKLAPAAEETTTARAKTTVETHDILNKRLEHQILSTPEARSTFPLWRKRGDAKRRKEQGPRPLSGYAKYF